MAKARGKARGAKARARSMGRTMASFYDARNGIYRSGRPPLELPSDRSLVGFFLRRTSSPDVAHRMALIDAATGTGITFEQLKHRMMAVAAALTTSLRMLRPGDVVLILSASSARFVEVFLGVIAAGGVVTTVNPLNTAAEIRKQALDSRPSIVFTTAELVHKVRPLELPIVIMDDDGARDRDRNTMMYESLLQGSATAASSFRLHQAEQDDTAALLYSSGTTGVSKGVMLSHRNFIAAASQVNVDAELEGRSATGGDVLLCLLPMFHVFGLAAATFGSLQRADTVVVLSKFELPELLRCVQEFKVSQLPLVPPVVIALAKHSIVDAYDLGSLRNIISGAAPLGKELMLECRRRLPSADIRQGYGLTESTGMSLLTLANEDPSFMGSAGCLVAGVEAMVVDVGTGKPLPPNKEGELWVRGPHIMKGYLNNPSATAETIDNDGWLHTGDLVYVNEQGRVYIMDRIKELIKYKGFQVAPAELEALLLSHPSILDAAVVPFPDDEAGQVPVGYAVRKPGLSVDESQVLEFVASQVAPYKRLRKIIFVDSIPKSAAGKILRRELRQALPSKL